MCILRGMSDHHPDHPPHKHSAETTGPPPADRKGDRPPAATEGSDDSLSGRMPAPALEATRKTKRQATSAVAHVAPVPADDDPLLSFTPYLHSAPRSNSITPDRQRRFIATLAATGIVSQAARSVGKSIEALYKLRARPGAEGFAGAWDAALARGVQRLEDCAMERSLVGTRTPIVSGGEILGHWDKPDNTLLRFLLQHRLPQKYGKSAELGPGHPVYDALEAKMLEEVKAYKAKLHREVTPRAMALQVYRRRARYRQRLRAGDDTPLGDFWDTVDETGLPCLSGSFYNNPVEDKIAEDFLEELERDRPFEKY